MRRLAAEQMLDYALLHGTLARDDLLRLASRLASFYPLLPSEPVTPVHYRARLLRRVAGAAGELSRRDYQLPQARVRDLCKAQSAVLERLAPELDERVRAGHIVECHGDLRPEHVYLHQSLAVIDCLEFSHQLRVADAADELAFLALECERLGMPASGRALLQAYGQLSRDAPPPELLDFYQSCRAGTRAVIAARHLLDEEFRDSPHWQRRACQYLQLAEEHIEACH
jgi:aminoglycoside phosphotransferase family enzyme